MTARTVRAPRVLYTTADRSSQSGAFRSLLAMSAGIESFGYQSILVLPDGDRRTMLPVGVDPSRLRVAPIPLLQRGRSVSQYADDARKTVATIGALVRIIRGEGVALVHANEILDIYAAIAARIAGIPCVWHIRADFSSAPRALAWSFPRIAVALSAEIVVVSSSTYEHVFLQHGVSSRKVSVIHDPGPDSAVFHPGVDGSTVRRELTESEDANLVVLIAKLEEPKGHEILIRAAPLVLATFPNTRFAIVGGDLDGAHHRRYAERMRRLPGQLGVDDAIVFTGYRSDVAEVMAAADVVVHCSTYPDPFPGVVLQGMALGKAVIASDLGGPREQVEDGISGLLVRSGDPPSLARALRELLGHPERRASLGAAAARRVSSEFTSEAFYGQLSQLYQRHLVPRRGRPRESVRLSGGGSE